jgi:hypothetical protein
MILSVYHSGNTHLHMRNEGRSMEAWRHGVNLYWIVDTNAGLVRSRIAAVSYHGCSPTATM